MKISIKKNKLGKLDLYSKIYYILWLIFSSTYILIMNAETRYIYSNAVNIYNVIQKILIVCVLVLFCTGRSFTKKTLPMYMMVMVLVVASFLAIGDVYFIAMISFILPADRIDLDRFLRFDIKLRIILCFLIIGLCLAGVFPNYTNVFNGILKMAYGFAHPNTLAAYVISILMEWVVIRYFKMKIWDWIGICSVVILLWNVAASRTTLYTFVAVLIFVAIVKVFPKLLQVQFVQESIAILPMILTVCSYILVQMYNKGNIIAMLLNSWMSNRIKAAARVYNAYGFSIFGQKVEVYGARTITSTVTQFYSVDMGYIIIPIHYGLLCLAFMLVGYYITSKELLKKRYYGLVTAILFFIISGFAEMYIGKIQFNFTLLFLACHIQNYTRRVQNVREENASLP